MGRSLKHLVTSHSRLARLRSGIRQPARQTGINPSAPGHGDIASESSISCSGTSACPACGSGSGGGLALVTIKSSMSRSRYPGCFSTSVMKGKEERATWLPYLRIPRRSSRPEISWLHLSCWRSQGHRSLCDRRRFFEAIAEGGAPHKHDVLDRTVVWHYGDSRGTLDFWRLQKSCVIASTTASLWF